LLHLKTAYLLVAHGSRDPRPQIGLERLAYLVSQCLVSQLTQAQPSLSPYAKIPSRQSKTLLLEHQPLVEIATLEFAPISLAQKIPLFAHIAKNQGYEQVKIIPLFLGAGVHVTEDLPREIEEAKANLQDEIKITLCPYLGSDPAIIKVLQQKFQQYDSEGKILFAHGSRKPHANLPIESIASQLEALNAYWAVHPCLEDQVTNLVTQGVQSITVLPYFLFEGGITEAITVKINQLQALYPDVKIVLDTPLGATPTLAQLIAQKY
jgi:sirohydrochlorin cobaltochelatase